MFCDPPKKIWGRGPNPRIDVYECHQHVHFSERSNPQNKQTTVIKTYKCRKIQIQCNYPDLTPLPNIFLATSQTIGDTTPVCF